MGSSPYYGRAIPRPNWENRKSKQSAKFGRQLQLGKYDQAKRLSLSLMGFCSLMLITFFTVSKLFNFSTPLSDNKEEVVFIESTQNDRLEEINAKLEFQLEDIGRSNETERNNSRSTEEVSVSQQSDTAQLDLTIQKEQIQDVKLGTDSSYNQDAVVTKEEDDTMLDNDISLENMTIVSNSSNTQNILISKTEEENEDESTNIKSTITCDENSIDEGFPYARPAICEITGEIAINPISSLVTVISSPNQGYVEKKIRPYARKDVNLFPKVKEITLRPVLTESSDQVPRCTVTHDVPAVIFSVSGYTGNFFHDMADVLIPLYLTSHGFNGEVQFFVTNYDQKWIQKYRPILARLSRYHIVNLDRDKNMHCVKHAFLGLFRDRDLIIRPHATRNPNNYTMFDFTKFLRRVYGLKRSNPIMLGEILHKRPKMLIISRKGTRRITNLREVARISRELGFEVAVSEAGGNVKRYANLVNSCDVMLAVHGAGLTNQIFLPPNAVLIQVVPWGKMDWMATNFYGRPAVGMGLKYLEYGIKEDESSLIQRYPRDHVVFRDPYSIHLQGWEELSTVIMSQNVRINLRRFKETLLTAIDLLQE